MKNPEQSSYINPETWNNEELKPTFAIFDVVAECIDLEPTDERLIILNDLYKTYSASDQELLEISLHLKTQGILDNRDSLYFVIILATIKRFVPNLNFIQRYLTSKNFDSIAVDDIIFPNNPTVELFLKDIILKIKDGK